MKLKRETWNGCLWMPQIEKAFISIPKNGTTQISKGIRTTWHTDPMWIWELPLCEDIVVMWRNPFDRLVSFYEYVRQINPKYVTQREVVAMPDFPTFVRNVCAVPDCERNMHYRSQYEQCCVNGQFIPTNVVRWDFEELRRVLGFNRYPPEQNNRTERHGEYWDVDLQGLVREHFARDLEVWECQTS